MFCNLWLADTEGTINHELYTAAPTPHASTVQVPPFFRKLVSVNRLLTMTATIEPIRSQSPATPAKAPRKPQRVNKPASVPRALIYEEWKGKPIYYKGYRDVLAGIKTIEEVMSCSDLQGILVYLLNGFLYTHLNRKVYTVGTNESGLHLAKNDNVGNDLAIYEKAKVGKLKGKYFSVPPVVVIEVDIKADLASFDNESNYLFLKAQKMLDFGTERVIWILTETRKVFVASRDQKQWIITDWDQDIDIMPGCILNVKQLLDEEEIDY